MRRVNILSVTGIMELKYFGVFARVAQVITYKTELCFCRINIFYPASLMALC